MMSCTEIILNPSGGGPIAPSKVGPRLRMSASLKATRESCQIWCRLLSYFATDMAALVMPIVIGLCTGGTGRAAIVSVPPGEVARFSDKASHSASVRISVKRPDGGMIVALLEANVSTLTFLRGS